MENRQHLIVSIELLWSDRLVDRNGHTFWWLSGLDFLSDNGIELGRIDKVDTKGFKVSLIVREDDDGADHEKFNQYFSSLDEAKAYAMTTLRYGGWYPNHK